MRRSESEASNVSYSNLKVVLHYVITMRGRLMVALWELHCYDGLDPSFWLLLCRAVMPCNTTTFEGYVCFDVLASMNAIG